MLIERLINVDLSAEELADLEKENAEIDIKITKAQEILDEAKKDFKFETEPLKNKKSMILRTMRTGKQEKMMQVLESENLDEGLIEYTDPTSGKVVSSRPMTSKELLQARQHKLFNN